jgi:hypothetical protein
MYSPFAITKYTILYSLKKSLGEEARRGAAAADPPTVDEELRY